LTAASAANRLPLSIVGGVAIAPGTRPLAATPLATEKFLFGTQQKPPPTEKSGAPDTAFTAKRDKDENRAAADRVT
jgi:hypothetical protein